MIECTIALKSKVLKTNIYKMRYIQLHVLFYLFEFVLPAIADYGSALKLTDWKSFSDAYIRLFRFFLCAKSQGN